jgi:hypothetical protein
VFGKLKALAHWMFPQSFVQIARDGWEDFRDWIDAFAFGFGRMILKKPFPRRILYFGFSPGDDLLCTAALRELRKRSQSGAIMISNHPTLFLGNDDPAEVLPLWRRYYPDRSTAAIGRRFARIWGCQFERLEYAPLVGDDRSRPPTRHIIAELCARVGMTGAVSLRPYFTLTNDEKSTAAWAEGSIVIQSSGMGAHHPIRNKQWHEERFQAVVDELHQDFAFIQLGSAGDLLLGHVNDLRGATSIRESAAILHHARLYIGTVGFLMHLARAVECPSVIVFGGREAPWQSGYVCNLNLHTPMPCAPCWRWSGCDFDRRCMSEISVSDVTRAIRDMMAKSRGPLDVEILDITPTRAQPNEIPSQLLQKC